MNNDILSSDTSCISFIIVINFYMEVEFIKAKGLYEFAEAEIDAAKLVSYTHKCTVLLRIHKRGLSSSGYYIYNVINLTINHKSDTKKVLSYLEKMILNKNYYKTFSY